MGFGALALQEIMALDRTDSEERERLGVSSRFDIIAGSLPLYARCYLTYSDAGRDFYWAAMRFVAVAGGEDELRAFEPRFPAYVKMVLSSRASRNKMIALAKRDDRVRYANRILSDMTEIVMNSMPSCGNFDIFEFFEEIKLRFGADGIEDAIAFVNCVHHVLSLFLASIHDHSPLEGGVFRAAVKHALCMSLSESERVSLSAAPDAVDFAASCCRDAYDCSTRLAILLLGEREPANSLESLVKTIFVSDSTAT